MGNLRELAEADLAESLEGDWALPVTLIDPEGVEDEVSGHVLYSSIAFDPDTGAQVVNYKPVVVLRVSSLQRVPLDGEAWGVKIPITPITTAPLVEFFMERPTEGNSIGFIRLYLTKVEPA